MSAQAQTPGPGGGRLVVALALIVALIAAETVVGFLAHSLAVLSDAAHMLTDAGALILSLLAIRLAARPPAQGMTYGLKRAEILSALANGTTLLVLAVFIIYGGVRRLVSPPNVGAWAMLTVALVGLGINLLATWQLAKADRTSLNLKGAFRHIVTDAYAFGATALAACVILATGFRRADPVASLIIAGIMLYTAYGLMSAAGRVLLEGAPPGTDTADIGREMASHAEVTDIHDLHVWEITSGFPAMSAHVLVRPGQDCHAVRRDLEETLSTRFGITHTTLQVDHDSEELPLSIGRSGRSGRS